MAEKYVVSCDFFLNWKSINKVLTNFYQPIIGATAIAAYLTLSEKWIQFVEHNQGGNNFTRGMLKTLLKQLHLTSDAFVSVRQKLEAVDLLQTYFLQDERCWVFTLKPCLRQSAFCRDQRFWSLIQNEKDDNHHSLEYLEKNSSLNWDITNEVTVNFDEVFNEKHKLKLDSGWKDIFHQTNQALIAKNYDFHSYFYYRKEIIKKINFYELSLTECPRLILLSYHQKANGDNVFSYMRFSEIIENNYQHYQEKTRAIQNKNNILQTNDGNRLFLQQPFWQKKMQLMKVINSYEYAILVFKNLSPTIKTNVFNVIHQLKTNYNLKQSIINCLLEFVMLKNQGQFNELQIIKFAIELQRLQIQYLEEAITFLHSLIDDQWTPKVSGSKLGVRSNQIS